MTKGYAKQESETLIETIKSRRRVILAKYPLDDVMCQEGIISEALGKTSMAMEQYPDLKVNQNDIITID